MPPLTKPEKLKIDEDERGKLGHHLMDKIRDARSAMDGMLDDIESWRDLYEANLPEKTNPWPDCSNTCLPLIQPHVDSAHAGINSIVFGVQPWQLVNVPDELAHEPDIKERALRVQNMLQSVMEKRVKFKTQGDMVNLESLLSTAAVVTVNWREEYRSVKHLVDAVDPVTGELTKTIVTDSVAKHKGPWIELVDMDNFVVAPMTRSDVEQLVLVGHRVRLTRDEVMRKVKRGDFDEDFVDQMIHNSGTEATDSSDSRDEEKLSRMNVEGTDTEWFTFWTVIYGYDANGDGLNEDCVFTIHEDTSIIVNAQEYQYWHGRRNYVKFAVYPRPRGFFGRSQPQLLEHCQRELNAIHNQRVDANSIKIDPMFLKRRGALPAQSDIRWEPGGEVLVDDMTNDFKMLDINPLTPGIDVENTVREYAARADGIDDPGQGALSKSRRLATELNIASAQGGVRLADIVRRIQESVSEIARQVLGLCYQFMDDEELAVYQVERDDLLIPWEIEGHGNTTTANKMQRRQEAQMLYQMLQNNPFVAADLRRAYHVTKNLLLAHDIVDTENYIGNESDVQEMIDRMQNPPVPPNPTAGPNDLSQVSNSAVPPDMLQGLLMGTG